MRTWIPPISLILAVSALVAIPVLRARYVQPLYEDMRSVTEPSRSLVTRIHVALAMEGALVRDYTDSRDTVLAGRYRSAVAEELAATAELERLVGRLGPTVRREFVGLRQAQAAWHLAVDGELASSSRRREVSALRTSLYEDLLLSSARLDDALNAGAEKRWGEIASANVALRWAGVLIAVIALVAAVIVAWLGRDLRSFAVAAERRKLELEAAIRSRERLVRGITHDLKNPLHSIAGHAELLQEGIKGPLTPAQADSIARIRKAAADELTLINDLLDVSRAEAGVLNVTQCETDIASIIHEVMEEHRPNAKTGAHALAVEVSPSARLILTDPNRVKQILSNLISNALKYSNPGGDISVIAEQRIRSQSDPELAWTAIAVHDAGPGIPADKMEEIFEEFSRLEIHSHKPGSGLGLSIARRVSWLLGGDIEVANSVVGGSVFTLWLPPLKGRRHDDPL